MRSFPYGDDCIAVIKKRNNRVEEKLQLTSFASSTAAFSVERMDANEEKF